MICILTKICDLVLWVKFDQTGREWAKRHFCLHFTTVSIGGKDKAGKVGAVSLFGNSALTVIAHREEKKEASKEIEDNLKGVWKKEVVVGKSWKYRYVPSVCKNATNLLPGSRIENSWKNPRLHHNQTCQWAFEKMLEWMHKVTESKMWF